MSGLSALRSYAYRATRPSWKLLEKTCWRAGPVFPGDYGLQRSEEHAFHLPAHVVGFRRRQSMKIEGVNLAYPPSSYWQHGWDCMAHGGGNAWLGINLLATYAARFRMSDSNTTDINPLRDEDYHKHTSRVYVRGHCHACAHRNVGQP